MITAAFPITGRQFCSTPCRQKCPAQIDVPRFIRHFRRRDPEAALAVIKDRNPFPLTAGRTCPHPCENICRRNMAEGGVAVNHIDWEIEGIIGLGVNARTQTELGRDFNLTNPEAEGFEAIFPGLGALDSHVSNLA